MSRLALHSWRGYVCCWCFIERRTIKKPGGGPRITEYRVRGGEWFVSTEAPRCSRYTVAKRLQFDLRRVG